MIRRELLIAFAALGAGGSAHAQSAAAPSTNDQIVWTGVSGPEESYRVLIPCSKEEIAALRQAQKGPKVIETVGCKKEHYSATVASFPHAPPTFLRYLIINNTKTRISPEDLNGHVVVRTRDVSKDGASAGMTEWVQTAQSDFLLLTFSAKLPATSEIQATAEKFLNSIEFKSQ